MAESIKKHIESVEFEIYRSSPYEFDATAESGQRISVATVTVSRPQGSWMQVETTQHPSPSLPKRFSPNLSTGS